jgi:hypothetical protein
MIRSLFSEHQSLVATIVILAPLVWCWLQSVGGTWIRRGSTVLIGMAAAGGGSIAVPVLVAAQLVTAGALARRSLLRPSLAILAVAAGTTLLFPKDFRPALRAEPKAWVSVPMGERRAEVINCKLFMASVPPQLQFAAGRGHVFVTASIADWGRPFAALQSGSKPEPESRVFQEYFAESWSALRLIGSNPVGTGIGSWEEKIGTGFDVLERTGTTFANVHNGYLLLAVTLGPLGLVAWIWMLYSALHRLRERLRVEGPGGRRWVAIGAFAGLLGASVMMLFCPIATVPVAVYWILLSRCADSDWS